MQISPAAGTIFRTPEKWSGGVLCGKCKFGYDAVMRKNSYTGLGLFRRLGEPKPNGLGWFGKLLLRLGIIELKSMAI